MNVTIDIINEGYSAQEEFHLWQSGGDPYKDLPDRMKEVMTLKQAEEVENGDWIMLIDGEIENWGTTHPFQIIAKPTQDDGEWSVRRERNGKGVAGPFDTRNEAVMCCEALENESGVKYEVFEE